MLKKLGFKFFVDMQGKYMVKLPERSLNSKLKLIAMCLLVFESKFEFYIFWSKSYLRSNLNLINDSKEISPSLLKELYKLAKETSGNEILNIMKHHKNSTKTERTTLLIKQKLHSLHESFFKEFSFVVSRHEENELVQIECDTELFNNLMLIVTIILNDNMKNEAEKTLQNYLEIFFKQLDEKRGDSNKVTITFDCDEDSSSQYSTLSSFLGLQVKINNNKSWNIVKFNLF